MQTELVRVELKYRLSSGSAEALIAGFRAPDRSLEVRSSWVATAYLDLPDRRLLWGARSDPGTAIKLRVREYFDAEGNSRSPIVWIELKECEGNCSRKYRFPLLKTRVPKFLDGTLDTAEILSAGQADEAVVSEAVRRIRNVAVGAVAPVGAVRYRRFSVEGGEPHARLTVDEDISYHAGSGVTLGPGLLREQGAVAEVKYADGPTPEWCRGLLGSRRPEEYSKFGVLARLILSEATVA